MSAVTTEDIAAVLTEALAEKARLVEEQAAAKEAIEADSSPETFKAYFEKHAELGRQELRLLLLKGWAANLGVEVAA